MTAKIHDAASNGSFKITFPLWVLINKKNAKKHMPLANNLHFTQLKSGKVLLLFSKLKHAKRYMKNESLPEHIQPEKIYEAFDYDLIKFVANRDGATVCITEDVE